MTEMSKRYCYLFITPNGSTD